MLITELIRLELSLWTIAVSTLFVWLPRHNRREYCLMRTAWLLVGVMMGTWILSIVLALSVLIGRLFIDDPCPVVSRQLLDRVGGSTSTTCNSDDRLQLKCVDEMELRKWRSVIVDYNANNIAECVY